MTRAGIWIALALPPIVTAVALSAMSLNRASGREPIVLSEREVVVTAEDEDNTFRLVWLSWHDAPESPDTWFNREKLAAVGFDTSVDPASPDAEAHYNGMLPREAFVAFELDGPAWRALLERPDLVNVPRLPAGEAGDIRTWASRLAAVDAAPDGETLAALYPDARTHLITAATVWIRRVQRPGQPPYLAGAVNDISPNRIHVPREWASALPRVQGSARPRFTMAVRYGARFEPWVVGVTR